MNGKHRKEVNKHGIGQCSVPMWQGGLSIGFCDNDAYSKQTKEDREFRKLTGQHLYVPALACPAHGGETSRVFKDGNSWCAVKPDFIDLQKSPAGFGDTPKEARKDLNFIEKVQKGMKMANSRPIKFRAWDKKRKKMMWRFAIDPDGKVLGWNGMVEKWENVKQGYILMQLTGLKDKNGKDAYWDDIVDDGINPLFVITPDYHLLARLSEIKFLVIGNVHENGELLGN